MSGFQVGDVVVCVDASPIMSGNRARTTLERGALYRVTATFNAPNGRPALLVNGESAHDGPGQARCTGWRMTRFRKVLKADEHFTEQMRALKPSKVDA